MILPHADVIWDIDGTILLNDLPSPNWNDPTANHPTTGENVCSNMPIYFSHNYLNPELTESDLTRITTLLTGRPFYRKKTTREELKKFGIKPEKIHMFSSSIIYTHETCCKWKCSSLLYLRPKYYVDNDAALCKELQDLLDERHADINCISVKEWQETVGED